MRISSNLRLTLLCATSVVALAPTARAQDAATETVVVTGSRVIADAANSPTPLTVITTAQLEATSPSNIPDGLNKLPIFIGSTSPQQPRAAGSNGAGNVLNLRNFGAQRTLVLFDGHRVAPSNADGTVDVDVLPQMLMSRVDVVTGGASAVYGSDAVTGVVNFVLDKHFTGIKYNVNSGISTYADGASYQVGMAAGSELFGGRGHIEGSLRHYHSDHIHLDQRAYGRSGFLLTGVGSVANPYVNTQDARYGQFAWGGRITCTGTTANPCSVNGMQFISNGVIGPFNTGTPSGTATTPSGGDAPQTSNGSLTALLNTDDAFTRLSYNINDTTTFYIQGTAAQSYNYSTWTNNYIQVGTVPNVFYKNNPFIPAAAQAQLAGGTTSTFQLAEYFNRGREGFTSRGLTNNLSFTAGIDGTVFANYDWDIFYTHSQMRQKEDNPHNQDNARMYAAEDGVLNAAGNPVCYVSTTSFASLYPGCVPMNPFGPTALTDSQYNYFIRDSYYIDSQTMDDAGASIAGTIFDLPAGPLKAALSAEYRTLDYTMASNAPPNHVDCTGLRLCNSATPIWQGTSVSPQASTTENVWEVAGEADIPMLKDVPLVQSLSANLAGRYTDYSVSGAVETWKIGIDYHVNDDLRFRATTSVDIRAPTLSDLFAPVQLNNGGFTDLHTNITFPVLAGQSQGNPNLVPEVARTYTAGVVLTPSFIPGLTTSLDYYTIALKNAIGNISGSNSSIQALCEQSGGTSPYCALYVRPLPFSDHSAANVPSLVYSLALNTALNQVEGWDFEVNYGFELADIWTAAPGSVNLRLLANDQDNNFTVAFANAPVTRLPVPKGRIVTFLDYTLGNWTFDLEDRWHSGYDRSTQPGIVIYQVARGKSLNYVDININKKFMVEDTPVDGYFSIQNIINTSPPIAPNVQNGPNLYPAANTSTAIGVDEIGRYFTIGVRGNF